MNKKDPILPGQVRLILSISFVYVLAWFIYYSQQPVGIYPGPEAKSYLEAAFALAQNGTTGQGGYSLYTFVLSILAKFSVDEASLTTTARGLNAFALIFATGLAASTAGRYWKRNRSIWIAGLLVGLNPVLVFWAGIVSPCLMATVCLSAALWKILPWLKHSELKNSFWIGLTLSLAAAFETTLLPFAICWPAFAFFYPRSQQSLHFLLAFVTPAMIGGLFFITSFQLESPIALNFDSFGIRAYDALNNHEAYDGKSFGLFRHLHMLLLLNPIHWGVLFILMGGALYSRLKDRHRLSSVYFCICILVIFAISYALNDGASQARATMIPLLAIFGSGVVKIKKIWNHASKPTRRKIITGTGLLALFVYSTHFGFIEHKSWESDYASLANTNLEHGDNISASSWAEKTLELNPKREDMMDVIVRANFNEWALGSQLQILPIEETQDLLDGTMQPLQTPQIQAIQGIYHFKLRQIEKAQSIWQDNEDQCALAKLCLFWTGNETKPNWSDISGLKDKPYYELLVKAMGINRNEVDYKKAEARLDNILAFSY